MKIVYDEEKDKRNQRIYGISFERAREVFDDPLQLSILDKRFDYNEERWITIGQTKKGLILVVAHIYIDADGNEIIRIISARKATKKEREQYENYEL